MEVTLSPRARIVVAWAAVLIGGFILIESAHALRPFIWAIITAYIFHPLVSMIHRKTRLPKHVIATWLYLLLGLILTLILINVTPLIVSQVTDLQDQLPNAIEEVRRWLDQRSRFGRLDLEPGFLQQRVDQIAEDLANTLSAAAVPIVLTTFTVAIELLIFMIASFYFIVHGDRFMATIRDILNRRYHYEFDRLMHDINATLGAYIRGQLVLVLIMSTASFVALTILNVDYALSLAIATGFLELIPLIGPWSAGTVAVLITLFQDTTPFGWSNLTLAMVVGLTYFALRQLEDAFIIPLVIGRIVHLHPLLVIFVLVIGTSLGGVLGLILAVPVATVAKIIASFFFAKLRAREVRRIEVIRGRESLVEISNEFPNLVNSTVVLLIEPGALSWDDLGLVQRVADSGLDHAIALSVVTPDGIAGALATAAGLHTSTVPMSVPVTMRAAPL